LTKSGKRCFHVIVNAKDKYAASHAVITQISEQLNLVIALAISNDKSIVEDSVLVTGIINLI
jgi:hypothetical protein